MCMSVTSFAENFQLSWICMTCRLVVPHFMFEMTIKIAVMKFKDIIIGTSTSITERAAKGLHDLHTNGFITLPLCDVAIPHFYSIIVYSNLFLGKAAEIHHSPRLIELHHLLPGISWIRFLVVSHDR